MKIIELTKVKMGDMYPVIRIKFKTLFGIKERDAIRAESGWKWADSDQFCLNDDVLDLFNKTGGYNYILNKTNKR